MLRKDETAAGQTYKYAKVIKVHVSSDNRVRAADIEYKLPGESVFRTTTRPIHKLVLVIPVEEQDPAADQAKGDKASPNQVAPPMGEVPAPVDVTPSEAGPQADHWAGAEEERSLTEAGPPPPSEHRKGGAARHQAWEGDFQEEGQQAGAGHHCGNAKGGGRDGGHRGKTQEERETKEGSQREPTGSAQGECLVP